MVTHQQGVTDVTVQAPSGQQSPDVSGPEAQRTRRWERRARQGNAAQTETQTLFSAPSAPSHHPETREMDRPRASPSRTSLRVRSPGGPWPWGRSLACGDSPGQDPEKTPVGSGRAGIVTVRVTPARPSPAEATAPRPRPAEPPNRTWN